MATAYFLEGKLLKLFLCNIHGIAQLLNWLLLVVLKYPGFFRKTKKYQSLLRVKYDNCYTKEKKHEQV